MGTDTDKRSNTVDAGGAWAACGCHTVIDVLRAVQTTPAVDAHADVAPDLVAASATVLASIWLQPTLVHILCAVLTC